MQRNNPVRDLRGFESHATQALLVRRHEQSDWTEMAVGVLSRLRWTVSLEGLDVIQT